MLCLDPGLEMRVADPGGSFDLAVGRVRSQGQETLESARVARARAEELRAGAVLCDRPFHTLKRRRLEWEAEQLEVDAARIETSAGALDARIDVYADVFASICSASALCEPVAEARHMQAPTLMDLPPGSTAMRCAADDGVSFQMWRDQRDVQSVKCNVLSEMLQELVGEVAKPRMHNSARCTDCNKDLVLSTVKAMLVCPACGTAQPHLDATPACVAYEEGGRREMYSSFSYTYKRDNHLFERLAQMQAKSAVVVTPDLMQQVCMQLHETRVRPSEITAKLVKDVLKKLKKRKAYEYVILITRRLQGKQSITFTRETMEKMRRMFDAVQRPFERHRPAARANFLSYWYIISKFLDLLGAYDLLPYLTLLKGKSKLQKQDAIWRKICAEPELCWEFIPSC